MHLKEFVLFFIRLVFLTLVIAFTGQGFAQVDVKTLADALPLVLDNLTIILAVATPYLTTLIKRVTGITGDATFIANIILNAVAKGAGLFFTGQVTITYAIVLTIVGILVDKFNYDSNRKQGAFE